MATAAMIHATRTNHLNLTAKEPIPLKTP
jgi:hypothetical protein